MTRSHVRSRESRERRAAKRAEQLGAPLPITRNPNYAGKKNQK